MLTHGSGLRLEAVRLGVRAFPGRDATPSPGTAVDCFGRDDLASGTRRLGPVEVEIERVHHGDAATFEATVRNPGSEPARLEAVVLGFRFTGFDLSQLRFLKNGWQSWSFTGTRDLDDAGEPPFPSGPWLRGLHHALSSPPRDRAGWHESATLSVVGGGPGEAAGAACVAGVLEQGTCFGVVYLRREHPDDPGADGRGAVRVEVELRVEVPLRPGEVRRLDPVRVAIGSEPSVLLECFADLWGRGGGARTASPFRAGWCSWYHFFHDVTEDDVLRNLEALAGARSEIPIDVVQLDDGYQRATGDWLETNEKFPRGLEPIAREIAAAGFTPGLWTAPFCVVRESRVYEEHHEWLLRNGLGLHRGLLHGTWSKEGWVYALDTTQPEVLAHLESLFDALVGMGFSYQKLDFLYVVATQADARGEHRTRAERLRDGLRAIRAGAGEDAFLLGCGCPLGPAVGIVDGMRIGPDVAPSWESQSEPHIPGIEDSEPSTRSAIRSILHRAFMHRRLWLNDLDCLMARRAKTQLSPEEAQSLAVAIAATGGMMLVSDDVPELDATSRALVRDCTELAREVDAAGERGAARLVDLLRAEEPGTLVVSPGPDALLARLNTSNSASSEYVPLRTLGFGEPAAPPEPVLGTRDAALQVAGTDAGGGALALRLGAHESALARMRGVRRLAVFCDFDGTFSVQDVGSTLAKLHIPERRLQLWKRYERGELRAWEYTAELLDGFALPEDELDTFLASIDLDPGSAALVEWCASRGVPFRVLSDGFDRNLEHLQALHSLPFDYAANRLRYQDGRWRIEPGHPDDSCTCGTGTCKGSIIRAYHAEHPGSFCVHLGNGRVSDLCGAQAADLTFAKIGESDTLAPALDERGEPYVPFETLLEVVEVLDRAWGADKR